jgi:hypothetical protein
MLFPAFMHLLYFIIPKAEVELGLSHEIDELAQGLGGLLKQSHFG